MPRSLAAKTARARHDAAQHVSGARVLLRISNDHIRDSRRAIDHSIRLLSETVSKQD